MNRTQRRQIERQLRKHPWPSGRVYSTEELARVAAALGEERFDTVILAARIGTREALEKGERLIVLGLRLVALAGLLERPSGSRQ